ncbi:hypothetical protein [Methylobacterium sp. NEAU K]|uniref:hypothetical protein n=1 Tax=Methylobacterium sp. NEAU K TaxID=3064946 RepID=UPI002736CA8B|nr:hypothetical protein [Methylobacterium sp. NEAU K]MDP4006072.1 hypothetical protein [Methylobacterium sp. NEAU K]
MASEPEPLAVTDLGNGHLSIRVRASASDGAEFAVVPGLAMTVDQQVDLSSFVKAVPGSGQANVPEVLDLTLRPADGE